jgi:hypothetical protein
MYYLMINRFLNRLLRQMAATRHMISDETCEEIARLHFAERKMISTSGKLGAFCGISV